MYDTNMKNILLSVYILLTFSFFVQTKTFAQEEIDSTTNVTVQQERETVEEELQTATVQSLTIPQILLSILAPSTFVVIGYLMIKKLKL
jgi:ABC-type Fe3+-siderophore transport system permease subunit